MSDGALQDSLELSSHLHSCAPLLGIRSLKEQKRHTVLSAEGTEAAPPFAKWVQYTLHTLLLKHRKNNDVENSLHKQIMQKGTNM